jgi:large subunit ribosomal protein L17
MRNLARGLFVSETGRIITTLEKAKEARPFIEKLITLAKKKTLHARRLARARLGPVASCQILDDKGEPTGVTVLKKLFDEIGPQFQDRPGGYLRVIKRSQRRLGDAGRTAFLEMLKPGETKVQKRSERPPPAPRVEEQPPAPSETPEVPPPESPAAERESQAPSA